MLLSLMFVAILATTSALNLPGIPIEFTQDDDVMNAISEDVARRFADEFIAYKRTGIESPALRMLGQQLSSTFHGKDIFTKSFSELAISDMFGTCTLCRSTLRVITRKFLDEDGELNGDHYEEDSKTVVMEICSYLNLATPEVCDGLFEMNFKFFDYIINNSVADTRSLCGTLPIKICKAKQEQYNFSLTIDSNNAVMDKPKSTVPAKTDKDFKIIQITDIHYDPEYEPGSLAVCEEPLCCRRKPSSGVVEASQQAGYWSDYRDCDTPLHMIEKALDHMAKEHADVDIVYQTGDIIPHTVWATTKEGNIKMITEINDLIEKKFPSKKVYSCVGNHEPHPTNVFSSNDVPEDLNVHWLYDALWNSWSKFLPADTKTTILAGGYYTVKVKDNLRLITLNSMDCYLFNWWVFHDGSFAIKQLEWLHDTLLAAEKAGEFVHILSHIPSGDVDCWTVWAREYNRIIERFNPIISGIFNGHTHKDEINVHYSQNGHAMAISWNGGSLTTYSDKNPNYNVYQVEPETMQVVDYDTWIFDLVEANAKGSAEDPAWFKEYTFSETFTDDLSPAGLDALLEEMAEKPALLRTYWKYKFTSAEPKLSAGCDKKCLKQTLCRLATSVYDDSDRCKALTAKLEESLANEKPEEDDKDKDDDDDGAASIMAFRLTTIIGLYLLLKSFF